MNDNSTWVEQQFTSFEGAAGSYNGTWIRIYINSGWSNWVKINDGGNAATLETHPASDFVLKSDYDALAARVAALEAKG